LDLKFEKFYPFSSLGFIKSLNFFTTINMENYITIEELNKIFGKIIEEFYMGNFDISLLLNEDNNYFIFDKKTINSFILENDKKSNFFTFLLIMILTKNIPQIGGIYGCLVYFLTNNYSPSNKLLNLKNKIYESNIKNDKKEKIKILFNENFLKTEIKVENINSQVNENVPINSLTQSIQEQHKVEEIVILQNPTDNKNVQSCLKKEKPKNEIYQDFSSTNKQIEIPKNETLSSNSNQSKEPINKQTDVPKNEIVPITKQTVIEKEISPTNQQNEKQKNENIQIDSEINNENVNNNENLKKRKKEKNEENNVNNEISKNENYQIDPPTNQKMTPTNKQIEFQKNQIEPINQQTKTIKKQTDDPKNEIVQITKQTITENEISPTNQQNEKQKNENIQIDSINNENLKKRKNEDNEGNNVNKKQKLDIKNFDELEVIKNKNSLKNGIFFYF